MPFFMVWIWSCEDRSLKVPTCFPGCCLPGEGAFLGCWYEGGSHESAEGCTPTFPAEGNCLSLSVTSCFSHGSGFIETCWIINWAATILVLQGAFLLFYKMPLTNKWKSLEPVSRRLKGGRGNTQYHCGLLTPFLCHIQYTFCAQFSLISADHWKSCCVPE